MLTGAIEAMTDTVRAGGAAEDAGSGDFASVYARHSRDVFRYCLVYLRSAEETEDVVAEAFERGCRAWQSGRRPAGETLPWLLLIARRILIDRSRRRRLVAWVPLLRLPPALEPAVADANQATEFWLWFDRLASALTPRQRDVLLLRYQFDLPDEEIAPILGLSEPGVRSLAARALAALRQHPELLA